MSLSIRFNVDDTWNDRSLPFQLLFTAPPYLIHPFHFRPLSFSLSLRISHTPSLSYSLIFSHSRSYCLSVCLALSLSPLSSVLPRLCLFLSLSLFVSICLSVCNSLYPASTPFLSQFPLISFFLPCSISPLVISANVSHFICVTFNLLIC